MLPVALEQLEGLRGAEALRLPGALRLPLLQAVAPGLPEPLAERRPEAEWEAEPCPELDREPPGLLLAEGSS